jgi:hypothetical protein
MPTDADLCPRNSLGWQQGLIDFVSIYRIQLW